VSGPKARTVDRGSGLKWSGEIAPGEVSDDAGPWDELPAGLPGDDAPVGVRDPLDAICRTAGVRAPYVRWCGRGAAVRPLPIPINWR
jgi:hypothetical protein